LVPHAGDRAAADVVRRSLELNQPPFALIETYHDGPLPQRQSFATDGGGDVVVTAVKRAEDSDDWVVRPTRRQDAKPQRASSSSAPRSRRGSGRTRSRPSW